MVLRVGIYLFDEVEVLDFAGPFEVFSTASRQWERSGAEPAFAVHLLGPDLNPVRARGGMRVPPQHAFTEAPPLDVLVIPGGVITAELQRPGLGNWLLKFDTISPFL